MNFLGKSAMIATLLATFVQPALAFDMKSFSDSANKAVDSAQKKANDATSKGQSTINKAAGDWAVAGDTANLVSGLSSKLGVSTQQAAGGTAALFAMAQSKLPANQFSGITNKVSGLSGLLGSDQSSSGGLTSTILNNVSSLGGVQQAFSGLGLSPDMIGQFVPIITQFLGTQGVTGTIINSLQGLWTPAA